MENNLNNFVEFGRIWKRDWYITIYTNTKKLYTLLFFIYPNRQNLGNVVGINQISFLGHD